MVTINGTGANEQAVANRGVEYHPFNNNGTEFANITIKANGNNNTRIKCCIINDDEHSRACSHEAQLRVQSELNVSLLQC